jgi:hypothetical protein
MWAVPVFGCVALPALCVVGLAASILVIAGVVGGTIKTTDAYRESLARARAHPEVVAALGQPIEAGSFLNNSSVQINGSSGSVSAEIPLSGPKASGTLYVIGEQTDGTWRYSRMEVEIPGRVERIDLLTPAS